MTGGVQVGLGSAGREPPGLRHAGYLLLAPSSSILG